MNRIYLTVAYDGTAYHGSALQTGQPETIEAYLNRAVKGATGTESEVIGASRTDAGVHARGAVFVFDADSPIPPDRFVHVLNKLLPRDIRVVESHEVPRDFHPRQVSARKTYAYRILNASYEDPTRINYTWYVPRDLDLAAMQWAGGYLVGEHDFTSFCNVDSTAQSHIRTIYGLGVSRREDEIVITVTGSGFLYNMVRIIAGTLAQIGWEWRPPEAMGEILAACDRSAAGCTAPPQGLMLMGYRFDNEA